MALCYKDKTFCSAKCKTVSCHRNFTEQDREAARRWWSHDPDNAPVAFSDFSDRCSDYDKED